MTGFYADFTWAEIPPWRNMVKITTMHKYNIFTVNVLTVQT